MTGKPAVWFEKGQKDMEMAKRAMGPSAPLPDMACYHAQQCAEKYLKGYLVSHQIEFRWVHDLVYLVQLCREQDSQFETLMEAVDVLNVYSTQVRYPAEDILEPSLEDAHQAIQMTEHIAQFVENRI